MCPHHQEEAVPNLQAEDRRDGQSFPELAHWQYVLCVYACLHVCVSVVSCQASKTHGGAVV